MRIGPFAAAFILACVAAASSRAPVSPGPLAKPHAHLEGNANCLKCHASRSEGMDSRCLDCHKAIAGLRSAGRGLHARTGDAPCASCHPDHAGVDFALIEWSEGSSERFDHRRSGWPLEGKHAQAKCDACHRPKYRKIETKGWLGLDPACASCHEDPHRGALGADCARCHTPVDWKTTRGFDHAKTAFPLAGKHVEAPCAKCHQRDPRAAPVYKPLPHAQCSACHADPHGGRLGPACASCHNPAGFRDVPKSAFDHSKTRYPLRGAHRTVACASCHDPKHGWGKKPDFTTCGSCHRDPHAGKATLAGKAADCAACHSVDGFRPGTLPVARHAPDRYPLAGKHAAVPCGKCHTRDTTASGRARLGAAAVEMRPAHDRCTSCHEDSHGGQLAARPDRGECAACHDVNGWKPARFGAAEHAGLAVTLEGAHAKAACSSCHGPVRPKLGPLPAGIRTGGARIALRGIERECAQCHRDPHRFERGRACTECHDATRFAPARVGAAEHAKFGYALEGAHRAVPCAECHAELGRPRTASAELPFRDRRRACVECHTDPHGSEFGSKESVRCERCHDKDRFRPASGFDHDRDSEFRLGRGHARVACAECHRPAPGPGGRPVVRYKRAPSDCRACHASGAPLEGDRP